MITKKTLTHARRNLERLMQPCRAKRRCTRLHSGIPRIQKATGGTLSTKKYEDHIAGKGFTSMTHHNWVHKFIPMPQAMEIPDAIAVVDKGMAEA